MRKYKRHKTSVYLHDLTMRKLEIIMERKQLSFSSTINYILEEGLRVVIK